MYPGGGTGICSPWGTFHSLALVRGHRSPLFTKSFRVALVTSEGAQNDMVTKVKKLNDDEKAREVAGDGNEG